MENTLHISHRVGRGHDVVVSRPRKVVPVPFTSHGLNCFRHWVLCVSRGRLVVIMSGRVGIRSKSFSVAFPERTDSFSTDDVSVVSTFYGR